MFFGAHEEQVIFTKTQKYVIVLSRGGFYADFSVKMLILNIV